MLSESYLYTTNAIVSSLQHLTPDGIFVAQFGEIDYEHSPYRTTRFVATARQALADLGVADPRDHILVASSPARFFGSFTLSTILVKRAPFTAAEVSRFVGSLSAVPGTTLQYAPGHTCAPSPVDTVVSSSSRATALVLRLVPLQRRPHDGQRPVLLALRPLRHRPPRLLPSHHEPPTASTRWESASSSCCWRLAAVISAVFLLLPFVAIRSTWRRLPGKWISALFFAAIGFGFMFFEVTLMQLLNLFLGYPTYALDRHVDVAAGLHRLGALLSPKLGNRRRTVPMLLRRHHGLDRLLRARA